MASHRRDNLQQLAIFTLILGLISCSNWSNYYQYSLIRELSALNNLMAQGNDAALKSSLVWLAVIMVIVGICTESWKKIMATYVVGLIGIAGLILPDWDFFDRDFSRWTCPVTAEERASILAQRQTSLLKRSVLLHLYTCSFFPSIRVLFSLLLLFNCWSFTILLLDYSSCEVAALIWSQSGKLWILWLNNHIA